MSSKSTAVVLAIVMSAASAIGFAARPASKVSAVPSHFLEYSVPRAFGDWTTLPDQTSQVVNPQVQSQLDETYSEILARTYRHKDGSRVMLSIAYGGDQRGALQAHRPEVCYPGQGFKIDAMEDGVLRTTLGTIDVRHLQTSLGPRVEPVTYWFTVGSEVVNDKMGKRLAEIRLALTGQVPDGLLFRVSSIDENPTRAFNVHQQFVSDMMGAVPVKVRRQLSGLSGPSPG